MSGVVEDAVQQRVFRDGRVSPPKAFAAAVVIGAAAGVAAYRALRSG